MMRELCPSCGQSIPRGGYLTRRELDVLIAWWMAGSVRQAADVVGVGRQRAKNLLLRARNRNGAGSNDQLLAMHMDAVRSAMLDATSHNRNGGEA